MQLVHRACYSETVNVMRWPYLSKRGYLSFKRLDICFYFLMANLRQKDVLADLSYHTESICSAMGSSNLLKFQCIWKVLNTIFQSRDLKTVLEFKLLFIFICKTLQLSFHGKCDIRIRLLEIYLVSLKLSSVNIRWAFSIDLKSHISN